MPVSVSPVPVINIRIVKKNMLSCTRETIFYVHDSHAHGCCSSCDIHWIDLSGAGLELS